MFSLLTWAWPHLPPKIWGKSHWVQQDYWGISESSSLKILNQRACSERSMWLCVIVEQKCSFLLNFIEPCHEDTVSERKKILGPDLCKTCRFLPGFVVGALLFCIMQHSALNFTFTIEFKIRWSSIQTQLRDLFSSFRQYTIVGEMLFYIPNVY